MVEAWVTHSRTNVQAQMNRLATDPNAVIGESLSPDAEVPMDGYGFKIPESIADMTMKEFVET